MAISAGDFLSNWSDLLARGPAFPGEPGRPGIPTAPPDGRPLLPGEKPFPLPKFASHTIEPQLIAHVNATGTAHDWQDPDHGGINIGNLGTTNPHGRRGGITWPDGRAKYSQEHLIRRMEEGWTDPGQLKYDDRFWPQDSKPGDGSYLTPEAQELIRRIESEYTNVN